MSKIIGHRGETPRGSSVPREFREVRPKSFDRS
jgi:hypothetical protein